MAVRLRQFLFNLLPNRSVEFTLYFQRYMSVEKLVTNSFESSRIAGLDQVCRSASSSMTIALERGPREGLNKYSSGTCGVVTTPCETGPLTETGHILNEQSILADSNKYADLLRECIKNEDLQMGKQVHSHILQTGFKPNISLLNILLNMYAKCGSLVDARQVFDKSPDRDVFTWTTMMAGYTQHGYGKRAFEIYHQMVQEGVMPNTITFICVLKACASLKALEMGKEVHADIIRAGIASYINLENTLLNMYTKCGSIKDGRKVFDNMVQRDVVSWNTMIAGYSQHGCSREAFKMYKQMTQEGVAPDKATFICVLNACASLGVLEEGKEVHADIIKTGIASFINLENALVDMYAKCGSINDAREVFDNMAQRNVVSWSAMIAGYAQQGSGRLAFGMYEQMIREGVTPNKVTFICVVNACAILGALVKGKEVHANIRKTGIVSYINLENTLVDMYAKCGSVKDARQVFDSMAHRDVVSWNAMIAGYGQHGCGREALQLFEQMLVEGLKPNCVTYVCLLSACKHLGMVDEGRHYFDSMSRDHGLTPRVEHFGCMVDLLSRVGRLDEAEAFISKMPIEPGASVWGALLGACRIHGNVEVAERVANCLLKVDPQDAGNYVLLSNIYAAAGRWDDQAKVRKLMQDRCVKKEPGHSSIEVDNGVHTFVVEDKLHSQMEEILVS